MLNAYSRAGADRGHRTIEQHAERADVNSRTRRRSDRQELDLLGVVDLKRQRLVLVVDVGADRFEAKPFLKSTAYRQQRFATLDVDVLAEIFAVYPYFVCHCVNA